jgi:hypothetical protein
MNYASLEDAYGTPFGTRVPVTKDSSEAVATPPATRANQVEKHKEIIADISKSLPLDKNAATENFVSRAPAAVRHQQLVQRAREHFTEPPVPVSGGGSQIDQDKLSRILRLIEQNKTGYETSSTQDMFLYIVTGVIFLFTFDTFVMLGRSMGNGRRR